MSHKHSLRITVFTAAAIHQIIKFRHPVSAQPRINGRMETTLKSVFKTPVSKRAALL
jgi:hypothetical protein